MDAFYASVEVRDDPRLAGKPLIIGSLPTERGVVATCSYEARKYGVHSAMNIKEAYRLCPHGIYMHEGSDEELLAVVNYIRENGITMHYWGHPNKYIFVDRHQYWTMSDSDDDPTMILNRCNVDEYKYSIMWKGKAE